MRKQPRILVVGGGASGLAFALSCAHFGLPVRIVDKRLSRSTTQKATGVAQGVWHQLAAFGITEKIIGHALPMKQFVFHDDDRVVAHLQVPLVNNEPPAHLYPQAELERAMEDALASYGVRIEYGKAFAAMAEDEDRATVSVMQQNGHIETIDVDWLVAADGSRSDVRSFLGIPFIGRDYPEAWSVAEVQSSHWPGEIQAQLFLQSDGIALFLSQPKRGVIQGILNARGVAEVMSRKLPSAELLYERRFRVSLRRVPSPRNGRVWLIGDAAHVQSPVGGQGLNLAIWDGITLGKALTRNDTSVEPILRKRARSVLRFTDFDYKMLSTKSPMLRRLRNIYWAFAAKFPGIAHWFFRIISGQP